MTPAELSNLTWHLGIFSLGVVFAILYHADRDHSFFLFTAIIAVLTGLVIR